MPCCQVCTLCCLTFSLGAVPDIIERNNFRAARPKTIRNWLALMAISLILVATPSAGVEKQFDKNYLSFFP
jgi:hypothetical protein